MVIYVDGKRVEIDGKKFSDHNVNNFENYCIFSTWRSTPCGKYVILMCVIEGLSSYYLTI